MVVSTLIEKIQKELKNMWTSETTMPEFVPGGLAGRPMKKNQVSTFVFIILVILLAAIFWNAAANTDTKGLPGGGGSGNEELDSGAMDPINGQSDQNTEQELVVTVEEPAIAEVTITLSWEDEGAEPGATNEPDEFALNVTTVWGDTDETPMTANGNDGRGEVSLTFEAPGHYPDTGSAGDYNVTVKMGDGGDVLWGFVGYQDNSNDWTLTITYTYWREATEPIQE